MAAQMRHFSLDKGFAGIEFIDRGDHREHDAHMPPGAGAQHGAQLRAEHAGPVEADADSPPAQRRIFLVDLLHIGQHLVAADVESAKRHWPIRQAVQHRLVKGILLADARKMRSQHELDLGAEQANRQGTRFHDMRHVDQQSGVHVQAHFDAVAADGGHLAQLVVLFAAPGPQAGLFAIGSLDIGGRAHLHLAAGPVHNDGVAVADQIGDIGAIADTGDAERARHNGNVARLAAFLQNQAAQFRPVIFQQGGRPHGAGDDNGIVGQGGPGGDEAGAGQLVQQPVGQIVEIVQALAQEGVDLALQFRPGVILHALHRSFRREAGIDRLAQAAQPAAIIGEHAESFEHVALFA